MDLATSYRLDPSGIHLPNQSVLHRDSEYEESAFDVLQDMQSRHFWYQGRHRFLLQALRDELQNRPDAKNQTVIDLGGGCGGWIKYLCANSSFRFGELALGDSSLRALKMASNVVPPAVSRYQIDLYDLKWKDQWDVAFLLDVLEHLPQDAMAMQQIARALRPGGLLFVTTPALRCFWSYNDELVHHVRRYARSDFAQLAENAGLVLQNSRYFMFLLSPLLWLRRLSHPDLKRMTADRAQQLLKRTHKVPRRPLNGALRFIFNLETPLGLRVAFPWGTSILGVFKKKS